MRPQVDKLCSKSNLIYHTESGTCNLQLMSLWTISYYWWIYF